jgi:hypothetical protein
MDKNCIEGVAEQGERARNREALVTKARWRKCGSCAMKECDPYLGRSRLAPERATVLSWSEKSAEAVVVAVAWQMKPRRNDEGPNERECRKRC